MWTRSQGSRRPSNLAGAIHSLSYYLASAVADKDFTWAHATEAKFSDPKITRLMDVVDVDPAPPSELHLELGWHGHDRHQLRDSVHEHGGRAAGVGSAWHRVERRRSQVP